MPDIMRIKPCCWLFLLLTVCPVTFTDEIAAANAIVPFQNCCQKIVRSLGKEVESGFRHLYDTIVDYIFERPLTESVTQVVEGYFEKRKEWNIWNAVLSVLETANIVVWMDSASNLCSQGFLYPEFIRLIFATFWPVLIIPIEKEIAPAVLQFDKMYLTKFWSYLNLRKEEEKVVLPPPEESLLDKMANRILPGTNTKNLLNYLKKMLKNIRERIGCSLSTIVFILILSVVTSTLLTQVCIKDAPKEKDFTDEQLMEEYDFTPEFRDTLYEWLTPSRHRKYIVEDDDIMETRDSNGSESDESDYWLTS